MVNKRFVTHTLKHSIECGVHHIPDGRQVKMVRDVPHLCQFITIKASIVPITTKHASMMAEHRSFQL